jgi:hypothetical protein
VKYNFCLKIIIKNSDKSLKLQKGQPEAQDTDRMKGNTATLFENLALYEIL